MLAHKIACVIYQIDSLRQHVSYLPKEEKNTKHTNKIVTNYYIRAICVVYENYDEMSKSEESIALEMPTT